MPPSWSGGSGVIRADSWRVDGSHIKVKGVWTYRYRTVDSLGQTIDFLLSARRDAAADMKRAGQLRGFSRLRRCKYLNSTVEQDHRRIKRLVRPGLAWAVCERPDGRWLARRRWR